MDTMKDTTMQHVTDVSIAEIKRAAEHPLKAPVIVRADVMLGVLERLEEVEKERDALLARIEAMEQQKPAAWMLNCQTLGGDTGWMLSWTQSGAGMCNRLSGEKNERKLYLAPGAKGE